ncbi:MAG: hypothetical protein Q9181_006649 [Wetmoreana brouardii]
MPLNLQQKFSDQFKKDDVVYYNGARGSAGPYKVDAVLANGRYMLREQNGQKIKKIYEEGDLSRKPVSI